MTSHGTGWYGQRSQHMFMKIKVHQSAMQGIDPTIFPVPGYQGVPGVPACDEAKTETAPDKVRLTVDICGQMNPGSKSKNIKGVGYVPGF